VKKFPVSQSVINPGMVRTGKNPAIGAMEPGIMHLYATLRAWPARRAVSRQLIEKSDARLKDIDIKQDEVRKPGRRARIHTTNCDIRPVKPQGTILKNSIYLLLIDAEHITLTAAVSIRSFCPLPKACQARGPLSRLVAGIRLAIYTVFDPWRPFNARIMIQRPQLRIPHVSP
jgi:uncharacterized protein YjiS (DUF1127 family)